MAKNKISEGKVWDHVVVGSAVSSGDMVLMDEVVGIAQTDGAVGETIAVDVSGEYEVAKNSGDTPGIGDALYYRAAGPDATTTASTNKLIGYCTKIAAGGDATVRVRLKL